MSGVWVFKNGVIRLVENQGESSSSSSEAGGNTRQGSRSRKSLVHLPSGQVVQSYSFLEQILTGLDKFCTFELPGETENVGASLLPFPSSAMEIGTGKAVSWSPAVN
uniref:Uncharacterized protein n=1 Tax=Cannabis sativa TaxID=3483 RepID=A0A803NLF3_CANSA